MKERDRQKKRLYEAEDMMLCFFGESINLQTQSLLQEYVYSITCSDWWNLKYSGNKVSVYFSNIGGAKANMDAGILKFSNSYCKNIYNKITVIHELAHLLMPNIGEATTSHSPKFAWLMVRMTRHFIGDEIANKLEESFIDGNVIYSSSKFAFKRAKFNY